MINKRKEVKSLVLSMHLTFILTSVKSKVSDGDEEKDVSETKS